MFIHILEIVLCIVLKKTIFSKHAFCLSFCSDCEASLNISLSSANHQSLLFAKQPPIGTHWQQARTQSVALREQSMISFAFITNYNIAHYNEKKNALLCAKASDCVKFNCQALCKEQSLYCTSVNFKKSYI